MKFWFFLESRQKIAGVIVDGAYVISVSHSQFVPKTIECKARDEEIRIVLRKQVDITRKTIDTKDNPLGGADVTLISLKSQDARILITAKTNVAGEVEFPNLPPCRYSITAEVSYLGIRSATENDARQSDSTPAQSLCKRPARGIESERRRSTFIEFCGFGGTRRARVHPTSVWLTIPSTIAIACWRLFSMNHWLVCRPPTTTPAR